MKESVVGVSSLNLLSLDADVNSLSDVFVDTMPEETSSYHGM